MNCVTFGSLSPLEKLHHIDLMQSSYHLLVLSNKFIQLLFKVHNLPSPLLRAYVMYIQ